MLRSSCFLVLCLGSIVQTSGFSTFSYTPQGKSALSPYRCSGISALRTPKLANALSHQRNAPRRIGTVSAAQMNVALDELNEKLRQAAEFGDVAGVIDLAKQGADVNSFDTSRQNKASIHFAAHQVRIFSRPHVRYSAHSPERAVNACVFFLANFADLYACVPLAHLPKVGTDNCVRCVACCNWQRT
jgi:hypothetical protein